MRYTNYKAFAVDLKARAAELKLAVIVEDDLWQEELTNELILMQRVNDRFSTRYIMSAGPYLDILESYTSFGFPPPDDEDVLMMVEEAGA